ncbi:hypothetical protein Agub_g14541, partial [Astrephomene gubernaculifera]
YLLCHRACYTLTAVQQPGAASRQLTMVNKSRWKGAHERFPAHVEEARNSDGIVHRGYHLLEFRVAAELLRVGPVHSAEDFWAPNDWQLLLVVSEYMSALLEFLDWFWPDLGWEHHKQAIVLSKRLLQPKSPHTYASVPIDPQLRAAWQSFTYAFWHGTRHLPTTPPPGEPTAEYTAAREWLTKLVGERGFEPDGHIMTALQNWIQAMQPRLQEAFPSVDWSRWPAVVWPDPDCACRTVEKRGAIKRQQEEDYAVRWPLRVTQGRPKFNHLKVEARDGFNVAIPPVKNPPALGFLAVSDVMCAFKQATQKWGPTQPSSASYAAQQEVVQSFVQNVLREDRGPLAPGIAHEQFKYLGYVACSMLGWQGAMLNMAGLLLESAAWGPQPLALPGGAAALLRQQPPEVGPGTFALDLGLGVLGHGALGALGVHMDAVLAEQNLQQQLLIQQQLQHLHQLATPLQQPPPLPHPKQPPAPPQLQQPLRQPRISVNGQGPLATHALSQLPMPPPLHIHGGMTASVPAEMNASHVTHGAMAAPGSSLGPAMLHDCGPSAPDAVPPEMRPPHVSQATRTRPSPFLAKPSASVAAGSKPQVAAAAAPLLPNQQHHQQRQQEQQQGALGAQQPPLDGPAAMSLGGLSSMQDLIDGLPSHTDLFWSALLKSTAEEDPRATGGTPARAPQPPPPPHQHGPSLVVSSAIGDASCSRQALSHNAAPSLQPPAGPAQDPQASNMQEPSAAGRDLQGLQGLQSFDSGLPYGTLQYPMGACGGIPQLPRSAPDAPVQVQPPPCSGSPFQGTITTCSLPSTNGLLSGILSTEGTSLEPRLTRRSHGEVFTLSPVASGGTPGTVSPGVAPLATGDTMPSSPAVLDGVAAAAAPGAAAAGPVRRVVEGRLPAVADAEAATRPAGGFLEPGLPTAGRRTRQDVARAAAAAAADAGLEAAPGSMVEPCPKRQTSHRQKSHLSNVVKPNDAAERVESLGAFLTDHDVGLALGPMGHQEQPSASAATHASSGASAGTLAGPASVCACPALAEEALNAPGAAAAVAPTEAASAGANTVGEQSQPTQAELRQQLRDLLQRADALASQLLVQDPDKAPSVVLEAMQGAGLIYKWAQQGSSQSTER